MNFYAVLLLIIAVHIVALFVSTSFFVPDEYWQSLEVAHNIVYHFGYMTWEWQEGLRSFLYPGFIALIYQVLKFCHWDSANNLVRAGACAQAMLSAVCAALWVRWAAGAEGTAKTGGGHGGWRERAALLSVCTAWCWLYCAPRTLSSTAEAALAAAALAHLPTLPPPRKQGSAVPFLAIVGLSAAIRPTAIIPWIPICLYHIASSCNVLYAVGEYLLVGIFYLCVVAAIDCYFYNRFIISPFNFFLVNVYENISDFYGSHSLNWYLFSGLPTVLGLHIVPFVFGSIKCFRDGNKSPRLHKLLFNSIIFTLAVYSMVPHKEFRFILSVVPFALVISSSWLSGVLEKSNRLVAAVVISAFVVAAAVPLVYFGSLHQRGTLDVMEDLRHDAAMDSQSTDILFLMPCHSTPLYSHLHVNVSTRFLTCDPREVFHQKLPRDEADEFFLSPYDWLQKNIVVSPSHIVLFDVLYPIIAEYLTAKNFEIFNCYHHTHFPEGRVGSSVYLLKKV